MSVFKLLSDNTTIGLELKRKVLEFFKWQGKDLILKILNLYKLFLFVHWQKWQKCLSEHVLQLFSLFTKCAALNGELFDKFSKSSTQVYFYKPNYQNLTLSTAKSLTLHWCTGYPQIC